MAAVEERQAAQAGSTPTLQIWSNEGGRCGGKTSKRCMVAGGAIVGILALSLGLFFGLRASSDTSSDSIVGQAVDPNAIGCYADDGDDRVLEYMLVDADGMTPDVCNTHCEEMDYYYYALQYGEECWCGAADVDLDMYGEAECDYDCTGDETLNCGGYYAFAAYEVGTSASTPVTPTSSSASTGATSSSASTSTTPATSEYCDGTIASTRYASSSGIAYFEGGGCATLTDMYNTQSDGPLYVLDDDDSVVDGGGGTPTGRWLLTSNLRVQDGVTLYLHGTDVGGDCDVLRLESTDSNYIELRAHGGSLSFDSTTVTSWDTDAGGERTDYEDGRSYITCISEKAPETDCEGSSSNDMGECTMDIIDSTMGNLGFMDAESYGLTWKVRGFCKDLSNPEIFDETNVYGDIQGSEIYGMYYGVYTYGHEGGTWTNNVMRDNIQYGFDPHDDSDNIEIANNEVYGNGNHGIIASKRCTGVTIHDNVVYDGGEGAVGIFLHRSSDGATVYNNEIYNMQDAGFAIMESFEVEIYDNVVSDVKYGVRISLGGGENYIHDNTFSGCSSSGFYTYQGSDEPDVSDGRPSDNVFEANVVSDTETGVKHQDGDNNSFIDNDFGDASLFEFDDSTGIVWQGNTYSGCREGDSEFAVGSIAAC